MSNLLTWSYWFSLHARELMPSVKLGLLAALVAIFVIGLLARAMSKKRSGDMFWAEGGKRVATMALWMSVLGLFILWCTHELVYFFGARFWYLAWLFGAIVWLASIARFLIAVVPKKQAAYADRARIAKWIPKKS